jgi:hypothetical protein
LTDVYTGTSDFKDAADAKAKMRKWVGEEKRFSLMLPSMILRHGYCPIGKRYKNWLVTIKQFPQEILNW